MMIRRGHVHMTKGGLSVHFSTGIIMVGRKSILCFLEILNMRNTKLYTREERNHEN
jgi:hypothetical protein